MRAFIVLSMAELNTNWEELVVLLEEKRKQCKEMTGYTSDNGNALVSNFSNDWFSFNITPGDEWDFTLWDYTGGTSLFSGRVSLTTDSLPPQDFIERIKEACDLYSQGQIHCSDCKNIIFIHEVAGKYYAGSYCTKCWEGKWKEVEANENYG